MSFLDRVLGRSEPDEGRAGGRGRGFGPRGDRELTDEQALERYRYMLRTAPPDDIERAHEEAFAALRPEQRRMVLEELSRQVPPSERATSDDPRSLARMATRAELRQPGTMERTFGSMPAGPGLGGMFLSTLAGAFVGTAIAQAFFGGDPGYGDQGAGGEGDYASESDASGDEGEYGFGEDAGNAGYEGDFGGGDFGGGDFGGGEI